MVPCKDDATSVTAIDVGEGNRKESRDKERPGWSSLAVNLCKLLWKLTFERHVSHHTRRDVQRLQTAASGDDEEGGVKNIWNHSDSGIVESDDKWRSLNAGTAKQPRVVLGDQDCDEDDDEHEKEKDSDTDALHGTWHAVARVLGLASHDTHENLITHSPYGVDGAETCSLGKSALSVQEARHY